VSASQKITDLCVLVTRPAPLGELLCEEIRAAGGKPIYFPVITILPPADEALFLQQITQLNNYDWVVFISPQAVLHSKIYLKDLTASIAAIGKSTMQALQSAGLAVSAVPEEEWNSEGLLDLPSFQAVQDSKIAIIKGEGGRDLITNELEKRGASVTEIQAYQRALPQEDNGPVLQLLRKKSIDVILCTSVLGLTNLMSLFANVELKKIPLLVISERMRQKAEDLKFETIFVAKNASNGAVLAALKNMRITSMETQVEKTEPALQPPSRSYLGIVFAVVAFLLLVGALYFVNKYYFKVFAKEATMQSQYGQVQKEVSVIEAQTHSLADTVKAQANVLTTLQQTQTGFNRNEWRILEAEFLVKLANDKLQFDNNASQAIRLLQAADGEIRSLNDADLLPLRKALADDIASLQGAAKLDVSGIYLQLSALNEQVSKLPLVSNPTINVNESQAAEASLPWWKRGLNQAWSSLKQIVIVRYHQSGKPPLVLPEQQDYLYMNLHSAIEKAMWGLLHQQSEVYKTSLDQAEHWIKEYFVLDAPGTQGALKTLTELQAINVKPEMPTLSASLRAFQDYFASHKQ
jgi:uncharacterized protein HemX/uroporphyrinogen-III synthase